MPSLPSRCRTDLPRASAPPQYVFTIEGTGAYVGQGINTAIGSETIGSTVIGGGGEATAQPFDVTFPIHTDIFQYISARFQATDIGYAAINAYTYKDIPILRVVRQLPPLSAFFSGA
ncbi:MAG: hypothetical protein ACJ8E2_14880 [Bradyrhizobium sp.]